MQEITEKDNQLVTKSFNSLIGELNRIADDIKLAGAGAFMEGDETRIDSLRASVSLIKNFSKEVEGLSSRWDDNIFSMPIPEQADINAEGLRRKKPPTRLRVTFLTHNKEIQGRTAVETFAESLRLFRFDDVAGLRMRVGGYPLVSKSEFNPVTNRRLKHGSWYINFPSNTEYKKRTLDEISQALKIPVKVDIV